jgi:hypothetical protein
LAKVPIKTIDGIDYYAKDIDHLGKPFSDAVPIGGHPLKTMEFQLDFSSPIVKSQTGCPSHWPFLPQPGEKITLNLKSSQSGMVNATVTVDRVDTNTEKIKFSNPTVIGLVGHSVLRAGFFIFSRINWNSGFTFGR